MSPTPSPSHSFPLISGQGQALGLRRSTGSESKILAALVSCSLSLIPCVWFLVFVSCSRFVWGFAYGIWLCFLVHVICSWDHSWVSCFLFLVCDFFFMFYGFLLMVSYFTFVVPCFLCAASCLSFPW